jgi:23S rRNA (cytosine1962-C5)-methyltransferase
MSQSLIELEAALTTAWTRKKAFHAHYGAVRVLNASASGTSRLVLELYGKHAILFDYGMGGGANWVNSLRTAAPGWLKTFGWESLSLLDRTSAGEADRSGNHAIAGETPENLVLIEEGRSFQVEPRHPRNVGLFLDTRVLRAELQAHSRDARVLNLFCYTGSLGLAALAGDAEHVVQVDISARYLEWGRENLRLNNLPQDRCRFVKMDSERYLDWALKKGLFFDRIVLDPPVFSRFDGKVFRWADDYFRLADKCVALLSPGGTLYAVTNFAGIRPTEFEHALKDVFHKAGHKSATPHRIPLPQDYDLDPYTEELPEGNAIIFSVTRD